MKTSGVPLSAVNSKYHGQILAELHGRPVKAGEPVAIRDDGKVQALNVGKPRLRQDRVGPNKTEVAFGLYLANEYPLGSIDYEGIKLRLGNGVLFIPDWFVHFKSRTTRPIIFEVKGFMESDAAVKLKVAASQHQWADFHLVTKRTRKQGGGWQIEIVLP